MKKIELSTTQDYETFFFDKLEKQIIKVVHGDICHANIESEVAKFHGLKYNGLFRNRFQHINPEYKSHRKLFIKYACKVGDRVKLKNKPFRYFNGEMNHLLGSIQRIVRIDHATRLIFEGMEWSGHWIEQFDIDTTIN